MAFVPVPGMADKSSNVSHQIKDIDSRIKAEAKTRQADTSRGKANAKRIKANVKRIKANTRRGKKTRALAKADALEISENIADIRTNAAETLTNSVDVAQLKAEFATLNAFIQDALGPIKVKAFGLPVGWLVGGLEPVVAGSPNSGLMVMNSKEYIFEMDTNGDLVGKGGRLTLFFSRSSDCSGTAYVAGPGTGRGGVNSFYAAQGYVFSSGFGNPYYLPHDAARIRNLRYSSTYDGTCRLAFGFPSKPSLSNAYAVLPNDPDVTGVPNDSFATPVTIGR